MFRLKPNPAADDDTARLQSMWEDYEKYKHWTVDIYEWEEWAMENFDRPTELIRWPNELATV